MRFVGSSMRFNRSANALHEQFRALETLGEIDKLLLGSAELEQVLDAVLTRVQTVTRCDCVGITLRDADAPGRARVYLAGSGLTDLPVRRVELDDDMITTLGGEGNGLTVTRCEDARHSFLRPLKEIGAEFFWVWPVSVSDRVEAILSVGYREAPAADPFLASAGTQFAERLAELFQRARVMSASTARLTTIRSQRCPIVFCSAIGSRRSSPTPRRG